LFPFEIELISLLDHFSHPEEAYIELQTNGNRVAEIASLARTVIELAASDEIAKDIIKQAASELALSAVTAARRAKTLEQPAPRFSWAGNMMKVDLLRELFIVSIKKSVPTASFHEPLAEPIDGVALLPILAHDSPLLSVAHSAERVRV
jgi:N-acetylglucosamine kinase-like BadF-type ATPase